MRTALGVVGGGDRTGLNLASLRLSLHYHLHYYPTMACRTL